MLAKKIENDAIQRFEKHTEEIFEEGKLGAKID